MVRAVGWLGSACSRATLLPAVVNALSVDKVSAVAGLVTNALMLVCRFSAADLAASKASRFDQLPPLGAVLVVSEPRPLGPLVTVLPKYAASILRRRSRTRPSPTTCNAAGLESAASSLDTT